MDQAVETSRSGQHRELLVEVVDEMLDAVDEGLILVSEGGEVLLASAGLRTLFGDLTTDTMASLRCHIAGCVADPEDYLDTIEAAGPGEEVQFELVRPLKRVVRRRVQRLRERGIGQVAYLVTYRDVTRDAELGRMKSEFVARVSHELRTPMAAIKGFLGVVLDDESTLPAEQRRQFLQIAREQTDRLSRLIDDLLEISRIEAGRRARQDSVFSISALVRDVYLAMRPEAEEKGVRLVVEEAPEAWNLIADRDQIVQVLINLVTNAIRFTPSGGRVDVLTSQVESDVVIQVADTGCGIPRDEQGRIFDKFYTSRSGGATPGTGLGLAIANELVSTHGGRIEVDSVPGEGSTFTVVLPLRHAVKET